MQSENTTNKYHNQHRSEEIQDIIDRMPDSFGGMVVVILTGLLILLLFFGWVIRYPDVVTGSIVINTPVSPVKLVATSTGQLNLNGGSSLSPVKKESAVAIIENGVSYDTVQMIKSMLQRFHVDEPVSIDILKVLPSRIALGELTGKFYIFLNSLHQMYNFTTDRIYDKQIASLLLLNAEQQKEVSIGEAVVGISEENDNYINKAFRRDSILFSNKIAAEAEFDKSKQSLLGSKAEKNNALKNYITSRKESQQTQGRIAELQVQKQEKKRELELSIMAAYYDLMDNIYTWEKKYVLRAPFDGHIQFLKFWTNKQFVQAGEPVCTILPTISAPYGQVLLPAVGAGKVKTGQEVIVKLNDYPYTEYGSVKGTVASISLTTVNERTKDASMGTYLVTIKFDKGLTTNYGQILDFKHEATGSAEIITKDRKLIERLFDNITYSIKK